MSEIWKALLEVQKEAPALQRDGLNPHFKSSYVTLETVMETVLPILNRHGIVLSQGTDLGGLVTTLMHVESLSKVVSYMPLYMAKEDAQGYGAAMTYARRYAIMGMLGLVADADDDGNAASAPAKRPAAKKQAPPPDDSAFPRNWKELEQAMKGYGTWTWDRWREYGMQARELLYPGTDVEGLTPEQKTDFWERTLTASQWLMVKHDPGKFPLPTFSDMREAWAVALDGRELKDPVVEDGHAEGS